MANEAFLCIEDDKLVVTYGDDKFARTVSLELPDDAERELVDRLLGDVNLWANFLSSLSASMDKTNQEKVKSE